MEGIKVRRFFKCCKYIGTIICWFVFAFWGTQALQKFNSKPVSSSISFINGDDKNGNLQFPALTICIDTLQFHFEKSLEQHCPSHWIQEYFNIFEYCVAEEKAEESTSTTEEYNNLFGNPYDDYNEDYDKFATVDALMNFTNIEAYDIINKFIYGNDIQISKGMLSESVRHDYLSRVWIKTYEHQYGPCFTFDPGLQNVSLIQAMDNVVIELDFKMFNEIRYTLGFHTGFQDRFDRRIRQPWHIIKKDKMYILKLSKTKFESLDQEDSQCSGDLFSGPIRCQSLHAGWQVVQKYNCSLPWMHELDFLNIPRCQDHNTIGNVTRLWIEIFNEEVIDKCKEDILPCTRTVYEDSLEELSAYGYGQIFGHSAAVNSSKLSIQFPNPYVQVIKDSHSYDMQSLIGEVGGTLGLLLGLSFISVFDLFESILDWLLTVRGSTQSQK